MPQTSDVFVDPILTNISVKYKNDQFIADMIFPEVAVQKKTGFYFTYDKSNIRIENTERTGVSRANRTDYALTKTAYGPLVEHSLEIPIEYDILDQYDSPLEPRTDATETVTEKILLEKEVKLATTLSTTGTVTQNVTLAGTSQWNDYGNSNPFTDLQTGINAITRNGIMRPNTLVMGQDVWIQIINHPDFLDRIKYSQLGKVTEESVATLLGLDDVHVSRTVQNTGVLGNADALSYVWGKNAQLLYVSKSPAIRSISAGYTLSLYGGRKVETWDEMQVKAEFVRVTDYYQQLLVAVEAIYLIKNTVA